MVQQVGHLVAVPVLDEDEEESIEVGHVLRYDPTYDRYTVEYCQGESWHIESFPRGRVLEVTSPRAYEAYWMYKKDKYKEVMGYGWGN